MNYRSNFKRFFDIVLSLILIILLSPLILFLLIVVKMESQGSPLFIQKRVGKGGGVFHIFKIRTMHINAQAEGGFRTQPFDSRVTVFGSLLRTYSLDELPQVFNVLLGQMSFVGPRPDVPEMLSEYDPWSLEQRLSVRPGITGLSQVRGRSKLRPEHRLRLDLFYVKHLSLLFDLKILFWTGLFAFRNGN